MIKSLFLVALPLLFLIQPARTQPPGTTRFAVIGDFGRDGVPEADVAALVQSWSPDFLITTGDNNYDYGAAATIDANIGQYYHQFIFPYSGVYGQGSIVNRMFPSLGNHDWIAAGAQPYLDFFTLPGNERYYDHMVGNVHLFCIDSDPNEPDGTLSTSVQGQWLRSALAASTARWKVVYFHHPPYSSGVVHGSTPEMQWPFREWGASVVLSGHEHDYERLIVDGFPYFVNGLGGRSLYTFGTPLPGSAVRYSDDYGAQLVTADDDSMVFEMYSRTHLLVDRFVLRSSLQATVNGGWNIMSLPLLVADPRSTVLYPTANSFAYVFDQSSGYVAHDTLRNGEGFWLKFPSAQTVSVAGLPLLADTIHVRPGWNLIGMISTPVAVSSIVQIPSGLITAGYYEYQGMYVITDTLQPGKGYWVKVNQDGELVIQ